MIFTEWDKVIAYLITSIMMIDFDFCFASIELIINENVYAYE